MSYERELERFLALAAERAAARDLRTEEAVLLIEEGLRRRLSVAEYLALAYGHGLAAEAEALHTALRRLAENAHEDGLYHFRGEI
jgi:hypothetical protein